MPALEPRRKEGTMSRLNLNHTVLSLIGSIAFGVAGCALDTEGEFDSDAAGSSGTEQQAVWRSGWQPTEWASQVVGMTYQTIHSPLYVYTWYDDGWVCRGNVQIGSVKGTNLCNNSMYQYSAPNNDFKAIRGVGMARNTERMYYWYADSTLSRGTSDNATAYSGKLPFARAAKPGGGTFSMNELIEVDNSPNGQWYFYWKSASNGIVYRTTGTSDDADSNSGAQQVTVSSTHGYIVGIAFNEWWYCPSGCTVHNTPILTWYSDGTVNESTTSLNLAQ
jgi:hypothetical protein